MDTLEAKFTSGLDIDKFEALLGDYSQLHELHYKRNDVSNYIARIENSLPKLNILIITEPWCGDSLAIVPTLLKLFNGIDNVAIRFVLRDENPDIMDKYLTRGGRAIPKIIVMNDNYEELFNFGPRPQVVQKIYEDHRAAIDSGDIEKMEVTKKIRTYYSKDKGKAILEEFVDKLLKAII